MFTAEIAWASVLQHLGLLSPGALTQSVQAMAGSPEGQHLHNGGVKLVKEAMSSIPSWESIRNKGREAEGHEA